MITSRNTSDINFNLDSIGFGTNGINKLSTFKMAIKEGYRLFDSADLYNNSNELSAAIKESEIPRQEFFINYKIFPSLGKDEFLNNVSAVIDKFDYIDSIMLHDVVVENVNPVERLAYLKEILTSLKPHLESGKIKCLGVSNINPDMLKQLIEDFPEIKLVQNKFSHVEQDEEIFKICKENGIQYIGYGLFGGREAGACEYKFDINVPAWNMSEQLFPILHEMAKKYETTPHGMLLAWAVLQGRIQIPASEKQERMHMNFESAKIAAQMTREDQKELAASLNLETFPYEWTQIQKQAQEGNKLSLLKKMVGNSLPRHRLLDKLYHEDSLKFLFDLILSQPAARIELLNIVRLNNRVMTLLHFLEESLKVGEDKFQLAINKLKMFNESLATDVEKKSMFELLDLLKQEVQFEQRFETLIKFTNERLYLKNDGYFNIKKITPPDSNDMDVLLTNINILGSNKIIYTLNISSATSLKVISELIKNQFPNDFKEEDMILLKSFYIPHLTEDKNHPESSEDATIANLDLSDGDIIGLGNKIATQQQCNMISSFFHHDPKYFSNPSDEKIQPVAKIKN